MTKGHSCVHPLHNRYGAVSATSYDGNGEVCAEEESLKLAGCYLRSEKRRCAQRSPSTSIMS